jgi:predicted RNA binding protein YcfA (HicA-like mRNA interferase family)
MAEKATTYGHLDETLRSLGFTARTVEGRARIYKHERAGATIILPDAPFGEQVLPQHLIVVRTILKEYGLVDPTDLTLKIQKVS